MSLRERGVWARALVAVASMLWLACGGNGGGPSHTESPGGSSARAGWLATSGNRIVQSNGSPWMGRGVNIHDTRSCNACTWSTPRVDEVKRRIDEAVDGWGATFLRLDLESYGDSGGRTHWRSLLDDANYLADVVTIVRYIGSKPGVYVLLSLWADPTIDDNGWPTSGTNRTWERLAETFRDDGHVLFGIVNEPQANWDGAQDAQVWAAMNDAVAAIRAVEARAGTARHVISVQGTREWARVLDYYVNHPITAGGGVNIVYETHVYDPTSEFEARFLRPARTLPVIIGEFGPAKSAGMSDDDCQRLMEQADSAGVPYLAWTFHMRCSPDLLEDLSQGGCGVGMPLRPTAWGTLLRDHLRTR